MTLRLLADLLKYSSGIGLSILFGAATTAIFARLASPAELGSYLLIYALISGLCTPLSMGLSQPVLRLLPAFQRDGREGEVLHAFFWLGLLVAALGTASVALVMFFAFGGAYVEFEYIVPAMVMAFFTINGAGQAAVLEATLASTRWSVFATLTAFLKLCLPLLLFPFLGATRALLWGTAAAVIAAWLLRNHQQRRELPMSHVGLRQMGRLWREAASFGAPFALTGVGDQTLAFSDRFIIGALLGAATVGLYSTNYSIAEKLLIMVQAPLIYAAQPRVISLWEHGSRHEAEQMIRTATRWLIMVGVPVLTFAIVRSELLSDVVLGDTFTEAHQVIPIVTAAILIWAASQYGHVSFQLAKTTWIISVALLSAAAANVASVFLLTNAIGYLGGAIGTAIGYSVYALIVYCMSRVRGPIPWRLPWWTLAHTGCAAAAAAALWMLIVPQRLTGFVDLVLIAVGVAAGAAAYAVLLLVFKEVSVTFSPRSITALVRAAPQGRKDA
jgi:O-antigen/teichoic acid export membrane protein